MKRLLRRFRTEGRLYRITIGDVSATLSSAKRKWRSEVTTSPVNTDLPSLPSTLAPQPDSQSRKDDEGQAAYPERDVYAPGRHFYPHKDAKQLRKGDQPEEDRGYKRRRLLHLNAPSSSPHRWPPPR